MPASIKSKDEVKIEISGIILLAAAILTLHSVLSPASGLVAGFLNTVLMKLAGEGRFLIPILLAVFGLRLLLRKEKVKLKVDLRGALVIALVILTLLHFSVPREYILEAGFMGDGGGIIGASVYFLLLKAFGVFGLYIIMVTLFMVGLLLLTNQSIAELSQKTVRRVLAGLKKTVSLIDSFIFTNDNEDEEERETSIIIDGKDNDTSGPGIIIEEANDTEPEPAVKKNNVIYYRPPSFQSHPGNQDSSPGEVKGADDKVETGPGTIDDGLTKDSYVLPPLSLLTRPVRGKVSKNNKDINENAKKLEETLGSFGIRAKVTRASIGPAITRYEVQPPPGVKVSRIVGLADDIALSMASPDVRIEAPIPGKAVVGIEVPNKEIATVYLRELVETDEFQKMPSHLTVALGKDIAGVPVVDDLTRMPHLLIAGATGAGKSVCLNTLLAGILFKSTPMQTKFLIIDPKMVELSVFNGIPHLVSPVVTDPKKAATALRWAVKEMEYRYELFAAAGVRDIVRYNKYTTEQGKAALPLLVVVIDELADLMMVAPADVEDAICRLAQMARAAGIHLVVATQRPSVDIITGLIKANIPSRVSFAVSSQIDSRTILDMGGAEKLLGRGDMLFYPVGATKPVRVQGAYLSDREVELLVQYWKKQAEPKYDESLDRQVKQVGQQTDVEDELLNQAVKIFLETGHASISLLQRRLHIGYARATRLIDIMEKKGYVGGYEGSRPRAVLITKEEYDRFYEQSETRAGNDN